MDLFKALRELYEERQKLDDAIARLEELQKSSTEREREIGPLPRRRGRKSMDPESRRQVAERMKEYWAKKKAARLQPPPDESL